ncbi:MAG: glycosyltransferase family 2 protein [Elusimicrobia bacterium]|nr:glycosyltransferase family 2 protein [Elusimicrobiota bacterium]
MAAAPTVMEAAPPSKMAHTPLLSVLVPVYNEEENLADLGKEITAALKGIDFEAVLVDDGSSDRSFDEILKLSKADPRFKAVRLGTNFGQTAAMAAGIAHANGKLIACLDSDLQNDARDIPLLMKKLDEGYDVVSGWRKDRQDKMLTRRLPSMAANAVISKVTGVELHDYGCTLKLYRAEYLKPLRLYGEMHRFIPAFAGFMGARITEVAVNHRARTRGKSKYGLMRTFKVVLDLLTVKFLDAYLSKPNYVFGGGGIAMLLLSGLLGAFTLYKKFALGVFVKDQPLFHVSVFCGMVGVQLLLMGLLAEILVRIYYETRGRQSYFVRETVNL